VVVVEPSGALDILEGVRVGHLYILAQDFDVLAWLLQIARDVFLNLADRFLCVGVFQRFW
jgi:hypothetical protein